MNNEMLENIIRESVDNYINEYSVDRAIENVVKDKIKDKLDTDWEMRRIIETTVKERLDTLFKSKTKEVTQKVQEIVLAEMLKEDKDEL